MARNKRNSDTNGKNPTGEVDDLQKRKKRAKEVVETSSSHDQESDYGENSDEYSESSTYESDDKEMDKASVPIKSDEYVNSVFKVLVKTKEYDHSRPWHPPLQSSHHGTGFAVKYDGEVFLVTNAHVATQQGSMKVQLSDSHKTYKAKTILSEHACDLAILKVDDPEFHQQIKPLDLGTLVRRQQELTIHGFPIGGDELCITDGKVSRVELDSYCESGVNLLSAQVTAFLNPGNSGGPAISNGKIVGVAFQVNRSGEGLGFIIPTNIISHFLSEAKNPKTYKGFPDLHFSYQELKNPILSRYLGLEKGEEGIRVSKVPRLSAAHKILKPNDIIVKIDGHNVANDGSVDLDQLKHVNIDFLISEHFVGDQLDLEILRDGERLNLQIELKNRSKTTYKVQTEYETPPSYFFVSGIGLCNLTDNLLESRYAPVDLLQYSDAEKKKPGDEFVFIKTVLDCKHNAEYDDFVNEVVTKINGKKIHNLREAVKAVEENSEAFHRIETAGKHLIVVPNLDEKAHKKLLSKFDIYRDRSKDLKKDPVYKPACPEYNAFVLQYSSQTKKHSSHSKAKKHLPAQPKEQERVGLR